MNTQIVIRSSQREAYLAANGEWSEQMVHARRFASATEAEALCRQEKLGDVEILVMRTDIPPMRIFIRAGEENSRPDPQREQAVSHRARPADSAR